MKTVALDIGSTTVKAVVEDQGDLLWRDYQRHDTRQADKVLEFLARMESECGLELGQDRVFVTGIRRRSDRPVDRCQICPGSGCGCGCGRETPSGRAIRL